ncbi:MAG: glycosyltransferase family 9 protein, partial [Pseudomonadota bacterium]
HAEPLGMVFDLQTQNRTNAYRRWFLPDVPWSGTAPSATHPDRTPDRKSLPSLERLTRQLHQAGLDVVHTPDPDVSWMAESVDHLLAEAGLIAPFVALIPGSSARHPQKRWPHFAALAGRLLETGYQVATAPGPDELDLCRSIPGETITGDRYLDYFQLAGFLSKAAFFVGNDTGPSHIAANIKRPGLVLFNQPGAAQKTGLDRPKVQAIERDPLSEIPVDEVFDRVTAAAQPAS